MSQSIKSDRISESTIARMAGNIAGAFIERGYTKADAARCAVEVARLIAAEVERTQPAAHATARGEE